MTRNVLIADCIKENVVLAGNYYASDKEFTLKQLGELRQDGFISVIDDKHYWVV